MLLHASNSLRLLMQAYALPLALLVQIGCSTQPVESSGSDDRESGDNAVLRWSAIARELMVDPGPIIDSRALAILHIAIHDAVNAIEDRYEPYGPGLPASPDASVDAAVATATRDVVLALSPSASDQIELEYETALSEIADGPAKEAGVTLGRQSARASLDARASDRIPVGPWPPTSGPITEPLYVPTDEPGDYAFTPPFDQPPLGPIALFPGWGRVAPFGTVLSKHPLHGPDPLASEDYARDFELLESVGSLDSRTRTADQTETAFFWFEELPMWNDIVRGVLEQERADAWTAARTLALLHLAMADAAIATFEAKYRFRFWRPITAIRRADEDGNPSTLPDEDWLPLLSTSPEVVPPEFFTPPIPDYPSAAATISAAAAEVLIASLGDRHDFEATSPTLPGVTRRFSSFSEAAHESGMSRVYGGIHFLRAVEDGAMHGQAIGRDIRELLGPSR